MGSTIYEMTQYIAPDGGVYNFDTQTDKFLISETGYGMPPINYLTQKSPLQHGETVIDYRLEPRVIQLVHRSNACSRIDYWSNRSALGNALRPNRSIYSTKSTMPIIAPGKLRKILPDGSKRDIDVFIEQGPEFAARDPSRWDEWAFTETLRFIAPDPTWYDPDEQTHTYTLANENELEFPMCLPVSFDVDYIEKEEDITYNGTWHTYPKIVVEGPASGFSLWNFATNELIKYSASVSTGETVTIDLRSGIKTVESDTQGSMIGVIDIVSDLATFHIAPDPEVANGVNNVQIYVAGGDANTSCTFSWYDRYIMI